ncbi:unnamed protein product [Peniophora sp. CBMAI 1063]|nr:unnamed protein product [Peniophora sp. CBMAI 1063]
MLFAFGPYHGRYCAAHGGRAVWENVPDALAESLEENHIQALALGENDAWFLSEAPRSGNKGLYRLSDNFAASYPRVHEIAHSNEIIVWVALGPVGRYVVATNVQLYFSDKDMMRIEHGRECVTPLLSASFGFEGTWICVKDTGVAYWSGNLPPMLQSVLESKAVRNVQLSAVSPNHFFVEYVDGETVAMTPSSWRCHDIEGLVSVHDVRNDEVRVAEGQGLSQRIVFAFGHEGSTFFMSGAMGVEWHDLDESVMTHVQQEGLPQTFALGQYGACFWRRGGVTWLSSKTRTAYPEVWRVWRSQERIQWVSFGPQGYYIISTEANIYASRSRDLLRTYSDGHRIPLRCGSFGYGGSWVVVEDGGLIRSHGLSDTVLRIVTAGDVRNVQLSPTDPNDCYVEYMNGTTQWQLPWQLYDSVARIEHASGIRNRTTVSSDTTTEVQRLCPVPLGPEVNSISYQFATSWRDITLRRPTVRFVYRISAGTVESEDAAHKDYAARIGNEQRLWHATQRLCNLGDDGQYLQLCKDMRCSLCRIIDTNYRKEYSRTTGLFGLGIYTTTASSKADRYSLNAQASKYKAVLLNNVVLGRTFETNVAMNGITAPPAGFNSVCGIPTLDGDLKRPYDGDSTCVFDDAAIRPLYLVIYSVWP